jgi:Prokaryotic E2 family A/ThiF family/Prokaryotic homologs of the JAB domain
VTDSTWFEAPGLLVPRTALTTDKARAFVQHLEAGADPYSRIIESRVGTGIEVVVFETEVSVPQGGSRYDIEKLERIAVVFNAADDRLPEILALRTTFPRLSHQNLRDEEFPRSLCITDLKYDELRRRSTPRLLVQLIRIWLERAALGHLHQEDQPLEPFFQGVPVPFLVPRDVFSRDSALLHVQLVPDGDESPGGAFVATAAGEMGDLQVEDRKKKTLALAIRTNATEHGVIRQQPRTLEDLVSALDQIGFDLLSELRRKLRAWKDGSANSEAHLSRLALILWIPKKRRADDARVEAMDSFSLITGKTVLEVGEDVGAWEIQTIGGVPQPAAIVLIGDGPANDHRGADIPVSLLPVSFHFDRRMAATMSGGTPSEDQVLVVGVGAIGSHVANNLARSGFGRLTLVDDDKLLPHNLSRHILGGSSVGLSKARALATELSGLFIEDVSSVAMPLNVLSRQSDDREKIERAIKQANLVLDLSASVAVARFLAHADSDARRLSAYVNPSGTDLVMLAEDSDRHRTLHDLELQFYRALAEEDALSGHYQSDGERLRYGQGCRDVSVVLPNERIALHGAIASAAIRTLGTEAAITIWRANTDGTVDRVEVAPSIVHRGTIGDWTVALDEHLVETLYRARSAKLPNETGGVILGAHDLDHRTIHLTVGLQSPTDSTEWPNLYIRGARDLSRTVALYKRRTDGMLGYVGEWHSHPSGCGSSPSTLDRQALANVAVELSADGLPALTLIVGERDLTVLLQSGPESTEARWDLAAGFFELVRTDRASQFPR